MTISRCRRIRASVVAAMLLTLPGSNTLAGAGTYFFQYEVGFGGKHAHGSFYLVTELEQVADAMSLTQHRPIRLPLYSTDRNLWTLYRALQPRPVSLALDDNASSSPDGAPAAENEPTHDSRWNTVGRVLVAGGALGVLVYLAGKEERRECTSVERALCVASALAGGGGCGCKF